MAEDVPKSKYSIGQLACLDVEGEQYVSLILAREWRTKTRESDSEPHWQYKLRPISWDEKAENTFLPFFDSDLWFSEASLIGEYT